MAEIVRNEFSRVAARRNKRTSPGQFDTGQQFRQLIDTPVRIANVLYLRKIRYLFGCQSGPLIALCVGMDYDAMKALMEASREESAVRCEPKVKEFPKPEAGTDWKYLDYVAKVRTAA